MTKYSTKLAALALAAGAVGNVNGAADPAAPVADLTLSLQYSDIAPVRWQSPTIFSARLMERGVGLSYGGYYSSWESRSLQMNELMLTLVPTERLLGWYARQNYVAKGRSATSRFRTESNVFGLRYVVKEPDDFNNGGIAVEVEYSRPEEAFSRAGAASATFRPTTNWTVAGIYSAEKYDARFGYTNVRGAASGKADVFDLALGKDLEAGRLGARVQGHAIIQRASLGASRLRTEVKPIIYGALNYRLNEWVSLEGDLTLMPAGIPVAGGRLTPMTSFQVYNPGGAVGGLRNSFVTLGGLRLVISRSF